MAKGVMLQNPEISEFAALRYVSLRLLWDCNLRCIMCDHPHRPKSEMPLAIAEKVLDQLDHPVRLTFIGGEPCIWLIRHPQVMNRALEEGHTVHLITNGVLLPRLPNFVNAFEDKAVSVQFSMEGYGPTYETIRKRSNWQTVVDVIRLVQSKRRRGRNTKAVVTVNYVLFRQTLDDLPRFIRFCAQEGIDAISLTYAIIIESMVSMGEIREDESVYFHKDRTNEALTCAAKIAETEGISLCMPPALGDGPPSGRRWIGPEIASYAPGLPYLPRANRLLCDKPWKEIFVNQDGTIVPCCCGPQIGPRIGHIDDGLKTLWNSSQIKAVRQAILDNEFHENCRCGINISDVGRQSSPENFFTRLQRNRQINKDMQSISGETLNH